MAARRGSSESRSPWLPFGVDPDASIRLVCLPHAGAGASVYRAWGKGLSAGIAACPVQPPGREKRRSEDPILICRELVAQAAPDILARIPPPYAIFGNSAGALCAFELAREIRRLGGPEPTHLIVAARPAPHVPVPDSRLAELPVSGLRAFLQRLGGTPPELLADDDFLEMLQPLIAADFTLSDTYEYAPEAPLDIPIMALAATDDDLASVPQMAAWKEHTTQEFMMHTLDGGHSMVMERQIEVWAHIADLLLDYCNRLPEAEFLRKRAGE
jgi:medium-chain acyl-[acyl-carrier-protein] hydrolase